MKLQKYIDSLTYKEYKEFLNEAQEEMGVTRGSIYHWLAERAKPSPINALAIEKITKGKVTKEELRPDIFKKKGKE